MRGGALVSNRFSVDYFIRFLKHSQKLAETLSETSSFFSMIFDNTLERFFLLNRLILRRNGTNHRHRNPQLAVRNRALRRQRAVLRRNLQLKERRKMEVIDEGSNI